MKGRIASKRQIRYYANISKIILIQTRMRIFLAKKRLREEQLAERDAAAYMIQLQYRNYHNRQLQKNNAANILQYSIMIFYLNRISRLASKPYSGNLILFQRIVHKLRVHRCPSLFLTFLDKRIVLHCFKRIVKQLCRSIRTIQTISRLRYQQRVFEQTASVRIVNFIKMCGPRHKFLLQRIRKNLAVRRIQQFARIHINRNVQARRTLQQQAARPAPGRTQSISTAPSQRLVHRTTPQRQPLAPSTETNLNHELQEFNRLFHENMREINTFVETRREACAQRVAANSSMQQRLDEIRSIYGNPARPTTIPTRPTTIPTRPTSSSSSANNSVILSAHRPRDAGPRTPVLANHRGPASSILNPVLDRQSRETIAASFQNPRVRDIYRNNRIVVDGHRLVPARGGGLTFVQEPEIAHLPNINDPPPGQALSTVTFECPICLDTLSISYRIELECSHCFCKTCLTTTIRNALGNIIDEIPIRCPLQSGSPGCEYFITHDTPNISNMITLPEKERLERCTLLKMHIAPDKLRYCPNMACQIPYEFVGDTPTMPPTASNNILNTIICFACRTNICTYCDSFSHPTLSCHEAQTTTQQNNHLDSQYFSSHCKRCPHCNCIVQKLKTPEQEEYERITGMSGGTHECHHMTCSACKQDFCWFCVKRYGNTRYYHPECPTADCVVRFIGTWPTIIGLPPGIYKYVDVTCEITRPGNHTTILKQYDLMIQHLLLSAPVGKNVDNTITITCTEDGIMRRMVGRGLEFTYKQENKASFN